MAKIIIHIPPPSYTLEQFQQAFDVSLETAFLIRRLIWYEFPPEDFQEAAPILKDTDKLTLSEEARILLVINEFVGGLGLKYLQNRRKDIRFPYIDRGGQSKLTLFYISPTFKLLSLAEAVEKYRLIEV